MIVIWFVLAISLQHAQNPVPSDGFSIETLVIAPSMRQVLTETAAILLAIGQEPRALTAPFILNKVALILHPAVIYYMQGLEINCLRQVGRLLVVQHTVAVQLVIVPLAFVGDLVVGVV